MSASLHLRLYQKQDWHLQPTTPNFYIFHFFLKSHCNWMILRFPLPNLSALYLIINQTSHTCRASLLLLVFFYTCMYKLMLLKFPCFYSNSYLRTWLSILLLTCSPSSHSWERISEILSHKIGLRIVCAHMMYSLWCNYTKTRNFYKFHHTRTEYTL